MLKNEAYSIFANLMLEDLKNEKKHMLFYLTAASLVSGPHREEFKEFFLKEAQSEMQHVTEFQDALLGLGVDLTGSDAIYTNNLYHVNYDLKYLIQQAYYMECEVVDNYAKRIGGDIGMLDEPDRRWMEIFYEKQIEKSREDVDNYQMILRGL